MIFVKRSTAISINNNLPTTFKCLIKKLFSDIFIGCSKLIKNNNYFRYYLRIKIVLMRQSTFTSDANQMQILPFADV